MSLFPGQNCTKEFLIKVPGHAAVTVSYDDVGEKLHVVHFSRVNDTRHYAKSERCKWFFSVRCSPGTAIDSVR